MYIVSQEETHAVSSSSATHGNKPTDSAFVESSSSVPFLIPDQDDDEEFQIVTENKFPQQFSSSSGPNDMIIHGKKPAIETTDLTLAGASGSALISSDEVMSTNQMRIEFKNMLEENIGRLERKHCKVKEEIMQRQIKVEEEMQIQIKDLKMRHYDSEKNMQAQIERLEMKHKVEKMTIEQLEKKHYEVEKMQIEHLKEVENLKKKHNEVEKKMHEDLENFKQKEVKYKERLSMMKKIHKLEIKVERLNIREEQMKQEIAKERQKCAELQAKLGRGKLELLTKFFGLVSLFMFTTGNTVFNYLNVLVLWIKPENLLMYMVLVVFAFQISPKELFKVGVTTTVFVGTLFGIYIWMGVVNKKANNWFITLTVFCIGTFGLIFFLSGIENPYCRSACTSAHLLLCIALALLIGIWHVSFKTYWYCILAVCCAIQLLILPLLYSIGMPQFTLIVDYRAALVTFLIATFILQHVQGKFSQDVITVKNCAVFKYVGSELSFLWRDYGIELHIPATDALIDVIHVDVTVKVRGADEDFQIPNDLELVSAIYSISTSRPLPVEAVLRIQHCVPGHKVASGRLTFVCARNGPPYQFRKLKGANFSQYSCYGEIKVSEFSKYAIVWLLQGWRQSHAPSDFVVGVYSHGTRASFVVTRNLAAHLRAVEEEMNGKTDKSTTITIDGSLEIITLAVPTQSKGWEVTSTFTPAVIPMKVIRDFQPGKAIPKISLEMEWLHREPTKPTDVVVRVSGLDMLEEFKLPCGRNSVSPLPPTQSCLTALLQYLKPNIQHSQFTGRLNINRDFILVRHLLHDLKKEELRAVGRHLGLSNDTVNNYYDNSINSYCEEIITAWMNERDNVLNNGGATWENLKRALESEGLTGHAAQIQ